MTDNPLVRLAALGQSPWYDFITRDLIQSGELKRLINEDGLQGMTSNPTIFEKAVGGSNLYDDDIRRLSADGRNPQAIFEAIAVDDVRAACDVFRPLYDSTDGIHGLVSIEVSPGAANDTEATIVEARRLWSLVGRPNAMIKIPATREGLPAISGCLAEGININITLLFALERHAQVIEAFFSGLERRATAGKPIDRLRSVASFFVSRVDGKVDPMLDKTGDPHEVRGKAAIANACMAYALFEQQFSTPRWKKLEGMGAKVQRPLWASTSTKDKKYPDIYYVEALIAANTVNTLPPATFDAYKDHGKPEIRIYQGITRAPAQLEALAKSGVDLAKVTAELETEGVASFSKSYESLLAGIESKAGALAGSR
ncbi:MAG: transaldolase [Gemmatimonadota bacterium]